jgi:hypothetical protein
VLIRFKDNLGSRDGELLGVDSRQCTKGAELDVTDEVAKRLIDGRFAVAVEDTSPPPAKLKGVPPEAAMRSKTDVKSVEPEAVPKGEKKPSA